MRRAERCIGVAVRRGQEAGTIRRRGETGKGRPAIDGREATIYTGRGDERSDTYAVTDNVSDEQYEGALAEAKAEENLSRANVVRKVRERSGKSRRPVESMSGEEVRRYVHGARTPPFHG